MVRFGMLLMVGCLGGAGPDALDTSEETDPSADPPAVVPDTDGPSTTDLPGDSGADSGDTGTAVPLDLGDGFWVYL